MCSYCRKVRAAWFGLPKDAYDDAVNMGGKTNGMAAVMLTIKQESHVNNPILNVCIVITCIVVKLCLYHDFISCSSGERL